MSPRVRLCAALAIGVLLTSCSATTAGSLDNTGTVPPPRSSSNSVVPSGSLVPSAPSVSVDSSTTPPDNDASFTDPVAVRTILADAGRDVVATNSYDYRTLGDFLTAGSAAATGSFRTQFRAVVHGVLESQARKIKQIQAAKVNAIGIGSVSTGGEATALVFGQLRVMNSTTSPERTDPFQAVLHLRRVSGRWLIQDLITKGPLRASPPGGPGLAAAAAASTTGATALSTYSRKTFSADYSRALALTTGSLRGELVRDKATTRRALIESKSDTSATVTASAVASAAGSTAVVLISITTRRSGASQRTTQNLKVTVERLDGRWLLSDIASVSTE